jgi:cell volume regulation protein A
MPSIELIFLVVAAFLCLSVLASKLASRTGIPALLLFLLIGMLAGSDGPGGIHFDYPWLAQAVGVLALVFILFSGGLDTRLEDIRPVARGGLALSTAGVFISALVVGWFASRFLGFTLLEGVLLGAIISPTDAAAVLTLLRSRGVNLKSGLKPLLELESGTNDPMAVFLTTGVIELLVHPGRSALDLIPMFILQMTLGGLIGYGMGWLMVAIVNRLRLEFDGLYPVMTLALVLLTYGVTVLVGGNGFLAIYLAGLVMGNSQFIHRGSLLRFHDGLAWLMQIAMFLTLGLQVFPSQLLVIAPTGLLVALFLIFVARPVSVFAGLLLARRSLREKTFLSWLGLRGAAPIILATFPLLAGIPASSLIFNLVFFIVLTSVLLQGTTISAVARWLRLEADEPTVVSPDADDITDHLVEVVIPPGASAAGRRILDLQLPGGALIVVVTRQGARLVPTGSTVLEAGDHLLLLGDAAASGLAREALTRERSEGEG